MPSSRPRRGGGHREGVHVDWGLMIAAAVLITPPLAVLFMFVQRHLIVGFGAGVVKG